MKATEFRNQFQKEHIIFLLLFTAYIVLCFFYGRLNYDEGYYLKAVQNVAHGLVPYKDFAFAQGAFLLYMNEFMLEPFKINLFTGRALNVFYLLVAVLLLFRFLNAWTSRVLFALVFLILVSIEPIYFLIVFKTYGLASLLLLIAVILFFSGERNKNGNHLLFAFYYSVLATFIRYSLFPFPLFFGIVLLVKSVQIHSAQRIIRLIAAFAVLPIFYQYTQYVGWENFWFHSVDFHIGIEPKFNWVKRSLILCGIYITNYFSMTIVASIVIVWLVKNKRSGLLHCILLPFLVTFFIHFSASTMQAEYQTVLYIPLTAVLLMFIRNEKKLERRMNQIIPFLVGGWLVFQPINFLYTAYGFIGPSSNVMSVDETMKRKIKEAHKGRPYIQQVLSQELSFVQDGSLEESADDFMGMFVISNECDTLKHIYCPDFF